MGAEAFARARGARAARDGRDRPQARRSRRATSSPPQEAQIARLAGDGLSNPEIGARAVHQPAHRPVPPAQGVREARHQLAQRARRRSWHRTAVPACDVARPQKRMRHARPAGGRDAARRESHPRAARGARRREDRPSALRRRTRRRDAASRAPAASSPRWSSPSPDCISCALRCSSVSTRFPTRSATRCARRSG